MTVTHIYGVDVAEFIAGYVTTMLWSSSDENDVPLDSNYSADDLSEEGQDRTEADCRSFLWYIGYLIKEEHYSGRGLDSTLASRAGHDFWLTRCGHGAGFWDGDWRGGGTDWGDQLTKAAKSYGNLDPLIGDDGKIHLN